MFKYWNTLLFDKKPQIPIIIHNMEPNKYFFNPLYTEEKGKLLEFFSTFTDQKIKEDPVHRQLKYMIQLV